MTMMWGTLHPLGLLRARWRRPVVLVAAAMIATPSLSAAQQSAADVRAIAAALAEERVHIAALKTELERRDARLAELITRLAAAAPEGSPVTAPVAAAPRFQFYADSRVRYETLRHVYDGCNGCPDRQRGRLRFRFGAEGRLAPDFTAVIGLGLGDINDPNTVYANLGNHFSRKVASWDRGYVEYHPTKARWMRLTAGKFPYTWQRPEGTTRTP